MSSANFTQCDVYNTLGYFIKIIKKKVLYKECYTTYSMAFNRYL